MKVALIEICPLEKINEMKRDNDFLFETKLKMFQNPFKVFDGDNQL